MRPTYEQCLAYVSWMLTALLCTRNCFAQRTRLTRIDNQLCEEAVRLATTSILGSARMGTAEVTDFRGATECIAKITDQKAVAQATLGQVQMLTRTLDSVLAQLRQQSNVSTQDAVAAAAHISDGAQQALQRLTAIAYNISTRIEKLPDNSRMNERSAENMSDIVESFTDRVKGYCGSLNGTAACAQAGQLLSQSNDSLKLLRELPTIMQSVMAEYINESRVYRRHFLENSACETLNISNSQLHHSLLSARALLENHTVSIGKMLDFASTFQNASSRTAEQTARIALQSERQSQKLEQTFALLMNVSRNTVAVMERQVRFDANSTSASDLRSVDLTSGMSNQTLVRAMINDIDTQLSLKMSSRDTLSRNYNVSYLMPKRLTYYDVVAKYLINTLKAIDQNVERLNKENSTCQCSVKPPFDEYEDAKLSATARASAVTPQQRRTISEIQAFSEYLSPAFAGFRSSLLYTGCQDAFRKGARESGIYHFSIDGNLPFRAWCDFDSSGGWMVIQRRLDGTVDFFRRWTDYEKGFGNLWGEYWLGLERIQQLTRSPVVLSIYMEAFDAQLAWANYSSFRIGDVVSSYTMYVTNYSGTAGDNLSGHSGHKFSTWDRDNDVHSGVNCAHIYMGGWWYNNCHGSNLNGRYERGVTTSYATANCWLAFKGYYYGLKVTVMRIRV